MKLSQKSASKSHRVLVFGPPKSGKTQLAGSVALNPKLNVLLFDLENGSDTLLKLPPECHDRIEVISIPDTRGFPIAIETMLKVIKGGPVDICELHGKVSCAVCKSKSLPFTRVELNSLGPDTIVIVDSLTQLTNSSTAHITKAQPEDYKMEFDDWANLGKLMETFLSYVQQAPYNIICISHETEVEMEDGKQKLVPTAGTRNFSRNTAKYFDEVVYCEVKNKKHVAASSTTYANNVLTGSRTGNVLESKPGEASLVSIFLNPTTAGNAGSVTAPPPVSQATPANKAVVDLQALAASMKGK
jgi:hypothetical protein